jgi:DNA replication protein DnaC
MQAWEFSTFPSGMDQNACDQVKSFVLTHTTGEDHTSKRGLYIVGPPGRGKTGLGVCALKEFRRAGYLSLFVSTADLMQRLRATFGKESTETEDKLLTAITETRVVVLDDLGVERPTPYVLEQLYLIIDKRHNRNLYTIFTSNMGMKDLGASWNPSKQDFHPSTRIIERMREYCSGVTAKGENLRA